MVDALKLVWLGDGAPLPVEPFEGTWHYVTAEEGKPETMRWLDAVSIARNGRQPKALVPIFEASFRSLIDFLCDPMDAGQQLREWTANPFNEDRTLYVALRSSYVLTPDGGMGEESDDDPRNRYLLVGVAQFPTILEGSFEFPWTLEPIGPLYRILQSFCRLHIMEEPPEDQRLVLMWEQLRTQREEMSLRRRKREAADYRARTLLKSNLDDEQKAELEAKRRFYVEGQDGKQYLILPELHGNVFLVQDGQIVRGYCCIVDEEVPLWDSMLAQKLLLETDIKAFMDTANAAEVDPPIEAAKAQINPGYALRVALNRALDRANPDAGLPQEGEAHVEVGPPAVGDLDAGRVDDLGDTDLSE